jgi:DNA mismatch repair protein MSH4
LKVDDAHRCGYNQHCYNLITELVQNEDRFTDVKEALKSLNKMDFDKLISAVSEFFGTVFLTKQTWIIIQLSASEARVTTGAKAASSRVAQMLSLRSMVKSIPALSRALEGSRSRLLKIICEVRIYSLNLYENSLAELQTISDARLAQIATLVDESLNEEATPAKVFLTIRTLHYAELAL